MPPPLGASPRSQVARRQFRRSVIPFFATAVLLCAVVVWIRDSRHIEATRAQIDIYLSPIARFVAENGTLPLVFPTYADQLVSDKTGAFTYVGRDIIQWARQTDQQVVIGYGRAQGLIASPNGHAVIFSHEGRLSVGWLTGSELSEKLAKQHAAASSSSADKTAIPPR